MSSLKRKLAALAAGTALALAAILPAAFTGPASCTVAGHRMPSGSVIKVDAQGSAWTASSDVPGPVREFSCSNGTWTASAAVSAR